MFKSLNFEVNYDVNLSNVNILKHFESKKDAVGAH